MENPPKSSDPGDGNILASSSTAQDTFNLTRNFRPAASSSMMDGSTACGGVQRGYKAVPSRYRSADLSTLNRTQSAAGSTSSLNDSRRPLTGSSALMRLTAEEERSAKHLVARSALVNEAVACNRLRKHIKEQSKIFRTIYAAINGECLRLIRLHETTKIASVQAQAAREATECLNAIDSALSPNVLLSAETALGNVAELGAALCSKESPLELRGCGPMTSDALVKLLSQFERRLKSVEHLLSPDVPSEAVPTSKALHGVWTAQRRAVSVLSKAVKLEEAVADVRIHREFIQLFNEFKKEGVFTHHRGNGS